MSNTTHRVWTATVGPKLSLAAALLLAVVGIAVQLLPEPLPIAVRLLGHLPLLLSVALVADVLIITPIRRVREGLHHMAHGDFEYRVMPTLSHQFEPLVGDFNRAIETLQTRIRYIEQQNWEYTTLYKALSALLVSQDMEKVAYQMAATLVEHFDYVDCGVMILDNETGNITRLGRVGKFGVSGQAKLTLDGKGLVPDALRSGQIIYVPDVTLDPRYLANYPSTRSELVVPLFSDGQVFGVIDLQSPNLNGFSERDRRIVTEFAAHAAFMLDNARLYQLLNRYNNELEQRVSTRTAELELALDRERQLNELKARFTSMVSHEFRTPLTVIKASNDLLTRYGDRLTPEKFEQHHQAIDAKIAQLVQLLDDVMFIHRSSAVGLQFNPKPTDISELVHGIVSEHRMTVEGARSIEYSGEFEIVSIRIDPKLVRLMLNNLLSNAIKYSPKDSVIRFTAHGTADTLTFVVSDEGIGIPQEEQKNIFDTYHRASNVGNIKGTGVGLSVVKRVVEAHNGTIDVQSTLNQGTIFTVTLPFASE